MPSVVVGFAEHEVARVRAIALSGFEEARARQWPFLSDVLERALRGVAVADGAVVAGVVHALVKYDRLLAFATGSEDAGARLDALLAIARAAPGERSELDARLEAIDRPTERRGVAFSFPDWLVELVQQDVGEDALESALAAHERARAAGRPGQRAQVDARGVRRGARRRGRDRPPHGPRVARDHPRRPILGVPHPGLRPG